ncbi:hypothetical protein HET68_33310, partial [Streptomyces sp. McG8]|nr:hypothetical protein [Streptomyces sp. McG8]
MSRVQTLTVAVAGVALLAPSASSAAESVHLRPSRTEARRVAAGSALPAALPHVAVPHRGRIEPVARDGTREVLTPVAGSGGSAAPGPGAPGPETAGPGGSGPATPDATASDGTAGDVTTGPATPCLLYPSDAADDLIG